MEFAHFLIPGSTGRRAYGSGALGAVVSAAFAIIAALFGASCGVNPPQPARHNVETTSAGDTLRNDCNKALPILNARLNIS
jgi:hypothetical protein